MQHYNHRGLKQPSRLARSSPRKGDPQELHHKQVPTAIAHAGNGFATRCSWQVPTLRSCPVRSQVGLADRTARAEPQAEVHLVAAFNFGLFCPVVAQKGHAC